MKMNYINGKKKWREISLRKWFEDLMGFFKKENQFYFCQMRKSSKKIYIEPVLYFVVMLISFENNLLDHIPLCATGNYIIVHLLLTWRRTHSYSCGSSQNPFDLVDLCMSVFLSIYFLFFEEECAGHICNLI